MESKQPRRGRGGLEWKLIKERIDLTKIQADMELGINPSDPKEISFRHNEGHLYDMYVRNPNASDFESGLYGFSFYTVTKNHPERWSQGNGNENITVCAKHAIMKSEHDFAEIRAIRPSVVRFSREYYEYAIFLSKKSANCSKDSAATKRFEEKPIYKIVCTDNYGKAIEAFKKKNKKPFTFEENIKALLNDYEANGDNGDLLGRQLDSITGIVYKAHSTRFKVIPSCRQLKSIKPDFDWPVKYVKYDSFKGVELDRADSDVKYNQSLTREEAKGHKGWLALVNGNKELLAKYVDFWFDHTRISGKKGMSFVLDDDPKSDYLSSVVFASSLDSTSGVFATFNHFNEPAAFASALF